MNGFIIICCVIAAAYGQANPPSLQASQCPNFEPLDVDVAKMSGDWFKCRESADRVTPFATCSYIKLVPNGPRSWSAIFSGDLANNKISFPASIIINEEKKLNFFYYLPPVSVVATPSIPAGVSSGPEGLQNYSVLRTDYVGYVVVGGCMTVGSQYLPDYWLLSRDASKCSGYQNEVSSELTRTNANVTLYSIDQNNCTYY